MTKIVRLPTAPRSFYTVRRSGRYHDVLLVTPCGAAPLVTRLSRWPDRASAMIEGKAAADLAMRPFKGGRA